MSSPLFSYTSPEAERILLEGYRQMSPTAKLTRVRELTQGVQQMALARLRFEHPTANEYELRLRLASLWLDPQIMKQVFGWDPFEKDLWGWSSPSPSRSHWPSAAFWTHSAYPGWSVDRWPVHSTASRRKGDRISERQWRDVLGVLMVRRAILDLGYLEEQADSVGLSELLKSALEESHA